MEFFETRAFWLIICVLICAICSLLFKQEKKGNEINLLETKKSDTPRLIRIKRMSEQEVREAMNKFLELYKGQKGKFDYLSDTKFHLDDDTLTLEIPPLSTFLDFAWILNHFVYCDDKKPHCNDIEGIYTFGNVRFGDNTTQLSKQEIRVFIPDNDNEYDIILFETAGKKRYKMDMNGVVSRPHDRGAHKYRK